MLKKLANLFCVLIMILIICELVMRVLISEEKYLRLIRQNLIHTTDLYGQTSWRLRRKNLNDIRHSVEQYDKTLGWRAKPNLTDLHVLGDWYLNTNSLGLRGKKEYSFEKEDNRFRIVLLGDSFTFGWDVSDHQTFVHKAQAELGENVEIMNFGVYGYGHDQMLLQWRTHARKYNPDLVILGFIGSDIKRNIVSFRDYFKPKFEANGNELDLQYSVIQMPPNQYGVLSKFVPRIYEAISALIISVNAQFFDLGKRHARQANWLTKRILLKLNQEVESDGSKLVLLFLPHEEELDFSAPWAYEPSRFFTNTCDEMKLNCTSAIDSFARRYKEGVRFNTKGHWGEKGHSAAADELVSYIRAQLTTNE